LIEPIEIIYDIESLEGTCYVEIKPGRYTGNHWNKDSIYFTDETFTYLSKCIEKNYENYSLWGMSEINKDTWEKILNDLVLLNRFLTITPSENEIRNMIGFLFEDETENNFRKNYEQNIVSLTSLINEFVKWISDQLNDQEYITILGI